MASILDLKRPCISLKTAYHPPHYGHSQAILVIRDVMPLRERVEDFSPISVKLWYCNVPAGIVNLWWPSWTGSTPSQGFISKSFIKISPVVHEIKLTNRHSWLKKSSKSKYWTVCSLYLKLVLQRTLSYSHTKFKVSIYKIVWIL